jgi:hypothetical protein
MATLPSNRATVVAAPQEWDAGRAMPDSGDESAR